jgi:transcriptional regulator with XRE-family HTH domain
MKFLGHKLKHLREVKNLSMPQLCELTGIKPGYISQIENDKKNPGPAVVEKLSEALDVGQMYFYVEDSRIPQDLLPPMPKDIEKFVLDPDNVFWLVLTEKAKREGIPLEIYKKMVETLTEARKSK